MRVQLRPRDQRGAIAVLSAFLVVILVGFAAFAVDMGAAYTSKRQLQTSVDSAALAAAAFYADKAGTCTTLSDAANAASQALRAQAQVVADAAITRNRAGASTSPITVACNASSQLAVTTSAAGTTPRFLGRVFGAKGDLQESGTAEATVVPNTRGQHVRPWALCSLDLPTPLPAGVVKVLQPGSAHTGSECPASESGGNWWFVNCPEDSTGSVPVMAENLTNGCDDPIDVVPNQPASPTPATLSTALTLNCNDKGDVSSSCLSGDTGNSSLKNKTVYEVWDTLLGRTVLMPVFCGSPTCNPDTVNGTGTNSVYPIYKIASVTVCGFHVYDKTSGMSSTGDCAANTFTTADAAAGGKDDVVLYLRFTKTFGAGDTTTTTCGLDTACDGGSRKVLLTK